MSGRVGAGTGGGGRSRQTQSGSPVPTAHQLGFGKREAGARNLGGAVPGAASHLSQAFVFFTIISVSRKGGRPRGGSLTSGQMLPPAHLPALSPSVPPSVRPSIQSSFPSALRSGLVAGAMQTWAGVSVAAGLEAPRPQQGCPQRPLKAAQHLPPSWLSRWAWRQVGEEGPRPLGVPDHVGPPLPPTWCPTLHRDPVGKGWAQWSLETLRVSGHPSPAASSWDSQEGSGCRRRGAGTAVSRSGCAGLGVWARTSLEWGLCLRSWATRGVSSRPPGRAGFRSGFLSQPGAPAKPPRCTGQSWIAAGALCLGLQTRLGRRAAGLLSARNGPPQGPANTSHGARASETPPSVRSIPVPRAGTAMAWPP